MICGTELHTGIPAASEMRPYQPTAKAASEMRSYRPTAETIALKSRPATLFKPRQERKPT